ncbi:hypothetical protein GCM10028824_18400 [Hymenobacter segetis]|uniref:Uncharacterized protein n=1 Tax=Hymenobacter segetis TaxID=2025509 RepID=A0ABU9M3E7_9BACT
MEQKQSSADYVSPLVLNGLFIANIVLALALASAHQQDGYLGGLGYVLYAALSVIVSAGVNILALVTAPPTRSTNANVIYVMAALAFSAISLWVFYGFAHMGSLKPGG